MPKYNVGEEIEMLADAGTLTERQAEAFVYRRVELVPRPEAADSMGIEESTLDDYVIAAEDKIEAARETVDTLDKIRNQVPENAE